MTYFRNNILHLLTLPALIAAAFSNSRTRSNDYLKQLIRLTFPFLQGELFLSTELHDGKIDSSLQALMQAGLLERTDDQWRRASAGTVQAVSLMRLAQVVMPALERDYLCASLLARAPVGGISRDELARLNQISAERLANTHGKDASELYDKHLHRSFVERMIQHGYVSRHEEKLVPEKSMLDVESQAHTLLGEQTRHAIINAALAAGNVQ